MLYNINCLDGKYKKSVNMNSPTCELNLDPASMKIMNVFKQDNIQTLRSENQKLRDRLRQFKESDAKKTQDLKVFSLNKFGVPTFSGKLIQNLPIMN